VTRSSMALATKITPVLRYRDPGAAAHWLCDAFGFAEHETVQAGDGEVAYVLLRLGPNLVLVRPVADLGLDELLVQPEAVGGANTQVCYVTVPDVQAHCAQAVQAGARIEIEPQDDGLGGQFYTCRDHEGHVWSFGTQAYGDGVEPSARHRSGLGVLVRGVAVAAAVALVAVGGWTAHRTYVGGEQASVAKVEPVLEQLAQERKRVAAAEDASKDAEAKLAEQRAAAGEVRRALEQALSDLTTERQRKDEAVAALGSAKGKAAELEQGKLRADAELAAAREKIAQERALAKSATERTAALQAQIAGLQKDGDAKGDDLRKARTALQSAQAALEASRGAKPAPSAEPAGPPPSAATVQEAEKLPAVAPAPDAPKVGTVETGTVSAKVPEPPEAKAGAPKGACAQAVHGRWKTAGGWALRLCQGAESSQEPVRCFDELMRGKVNWGGGKGWTAPAALNLCSGSRNAQKTLDCFTGKIAAEEPWQTAIRDCKTQ
jgi:uncharacterized glyoxalase superfamily protein PhnB